jgi:hypothetical protein
MDLSIEECVFFVVEYIFREGNRYTNLVQEQFAAKSAMYCDCLHMLNGLKTAITAESVCE